MNDIRWTPHAMHKSPAKDAEDILIVEVGSDYNGEMMYSIQSEDEGLPAAMTAAELRNFAIFLVSTFKKVDNE